LPICPTHPPYPNNNSDATLATGAPAVPAAEHSPGLDFFAPLFYQEKSGNIPKQNPACHQHNKQSPFVSLISSGTGHTKYPTSPML